MRMRLALVWTAALTAPLLAACSGDSRSGDASAKRATVLRVEASVGEVGTLGAWARTVERLAGGSLRLRPADSDVASHGGADFERRVIADVRSGRVSLAAVGARVFDRLGVRSFQPLVAPFLVDRYDLERRVMASSLPTQMLAGTRRLGVVGVAVLPGPMRHMLGVGQPFYGPRDFRGRVVGIHDSAVADETIRALGAKAAPQPAEPSVAGLDAMEGQLGLAAGNRLYREARYATVNLTLWPRPLILIANADVFRKLTRAQRDALTRAGHAGLEEEMALVRADDSEALPILCSPEARAHFRLVTSPADQISAMREATASVYTTIERDPRARAAIAQINAMKRDAKPDTPPACGKSESAIARVRTPLDGVYSMATRPPAGESGKGNEENLGDWIFVFDRGRFGFSQRFKTACTWGYGRVSFSGQTMRWILIDGGGIAPNHATNKPGEDFKFTWNIFHDTVTIGPVKGAISPGNFRDKPWRLISRTPSSSHFEKRCPPPAKWDPR